MHHTTTIPERPQPMLNETIGAAFRSSATLIANDRVHLVPYCNQLFEDHLRLRMALYPAITKFTTATTSDVAFYRKTQAEDEAGVTLAILDNETDEFVGEVMVHDFDAEPWELGWDVLPERQGEGYASSAASALVDALKVLSECPGVIVRTHADNAASIKVARKIGGIPFGIDTTLAVRLSGEDRIAELAREGGELLTDKVRVLASESHVEPEQLLTHVLVFKIA